MESRMRTSVRGAARAVAVLSLWAVLAGVPVHGSAQTRVRAGEILAGRLEAGDPVLGDGSHFDVYLYAGAPGERIAVTLTSADFDAYLSGGTMEDGGFITEASDDDGAGGTDSRLEATVNETGLFAIRASSYAGGETGAYRLTVEVLSAGGGSGGGVADVAVGEIGEGEAVLGRLDATDPRLDDDSHYDTYVYQGAPGEEIAVTMRSGVVDAYLSGGYFVGDELVIDASDDDSAGGTDALLVGTVGPDGTYVIRANSYAADETGDYVLTLRVSSAGTAFVGERTIGAGEVATGELAASDPTLGDGSHYDAYRYDGRAGETILITLTSSDFDAYLRWGRGSGGAVEPITYDDDGAGGLDARLEVTVPESGVYEIQANSYGEGETGAYTLSVEVVDAGASDELPQLRLGQTVEGRFASSDPVLSDNSHYRVYLYRGTPGEQVVVTLRSAAFDAFLGGGRLVGGEFEAEVWDDDSGGGTDAQILAMVGEDGTYAVRANTLSPGQTGAYSLLVEAVESAGAAPAPPLAGARTVSAGQTITGALTFTDPMRPDSSFYHEYVYAGAAGDRLRITLRSPDFDALVRWGRVARGELRLEGSNDDGAGGTDSELDVTVGGTGTYAILVNSYGPGETGAYELTVQSLGTAPVPSPTEPLSATGGKWIPVYAETVDYRALAQRVKQAQILEQVSATLSERFVLPADVPIAFDECGEANASFDPDTDEITFCYEMLDYLAGIFAPDRAWSTEQSERVMGAIHFILIHEVGHALIDVLDLPITGREEDAADQLAVMMLIEGGEKGAQAAYNGAMALQPGTTAFDETDFADEHSLGPVRLFNVACWIYGSDPYKYESMIANGLLPEDRAQRCPSEYERLSKSWYRILDPYLPGQG